MSIPKVTVLMPVYNIERYLSEAIESILSQTYTDFEFLIINDGSTDNTKDIITSYSDPRIVLINNEKNKGSIGFIQSLNRAIKLAKGEYIARMDGDDISLPDRLEKQVDFMETHSSCCVVGCKIILIDANSKEKGYCVDDQITTLYSEIYGCLPRVNCIAHPSVMMRKSVIMNYLYDEKQGYAEDYDLWLRLCADNIRIEKLASHLLKYRIHPDSLTSISNRLEEGFKNIRTKLHFLYKNCFLNRRINMFCFRVLIYVSLDIIIYQLKQCKRLMLHTYFKRY